VTRDHEREVVEVLVSRFPSVDPVVIHDRVAAAFETYRGARVQAYTPVLVQSAVRRQLRTLGPGRPVAS